MKPVSAGAPYRVPPEPSRWPAILLAVAVHALLLAFLWIGISWQNHEPVAVEAEVWDMKTEAAAPTPPPPQESEPQPEPEPALPPKPVEQPVEKPVEQPDIALEREKEKKRKEELLKKERERELAEQKKAEELAKKELEKKKADELAKKELEKKKKAEELAKKEAEKQKELDKKEAEKKALAEKKKAEKEAKAKEAAENARLAKLHEADLKRMMAAAGSGGAGTAAKSSAPRSDSGYDAAIRAKVKSTTSYGGDTDVPGNPSVEFHIEQLPTGEIISVKKTRSSGNPAFDDAVEKGIIKASPLPKKKDGTVERSLVIEFKMKNVT